MHLSAQAAIGCDSPRRQGWLVLALIVVVGIALRLIHITQPFVDQWSWRQSDVAMIARHFSEDGFRIWWPRIDWFGDVAGYVGTEFPLVPAVAALLYQRRWRPRLDRPRGVGRGIRRCCVAAASTDGIGRRKARGNRRHRRVRDHAAVGVRRPLVHARHDGADALDRCGRRVPAMARRPRLDAAGSLSPSARCRSRSS